MLNPFLSLFLFSLTTAYTYVEIQKNSLNYFQILANKFRSHSYDLKLLDEDKNALCSTSISFYSLNCSKKQNEWKIFVIFNIMAKNKSKSISFKLKCSEILAYNKIQKKVKYNLLKTDRFKCHLNYEYVDLYKENENLKDGFYNKVAKSIFEDEFMVGERDAKILREKTEAFFPDNNYLNRNVFLVRVDVYPALNQFY